MEHIKRWLGFHKKEVMFGAIIMLTASVSFGSGFVANQEFNHTPIIIEACSQK